MSVNARSVLPAPEGAPFLGLMPEESRAVLWDPSTAPRDWQEVEFWVPPFVGYDFAAAMNLLPRLRVIQLMTSGYDHLLPHLHRLPDDVALCTARGIHDAAVSEWVIAAMLAMQRGLPAFIDNARLGIVARAETETLDGSRVLIVGYGAIGRALEDRLRGFDVDLIRLSRRPGDGIRGSEDLAALLPTTDILVLLAPLTPQTRGMIDAEALKLLPDNALVINAARGEIVNQEALVAEVSRGRLRAALDVTTPDLLPQGSPLLGMPGILYTPHMAGTTRKTLPRVFDFVTAQARRHFAGGSLENVVPRG